MGLPLPCNVWEPVAAGHVERGPPLLVPLVDVCSVAHQQLHALQVPGQDGLVDGCHAWSKRTFRRSVILDELHGGGPHDAPGSYRRCKWCPVRLSWPGWNVQSSPAHHVSRSPGKRCHWGSGRSERASEWLQSCRRLERHSSGHKSWCPWTESWETRRTSSWGLVVEAPSQKLKDGPSQCGSFAWFSCSFESLTFSEGLLYSAGLF